MREINVPQDDAGFLKEGKVRDLCYAIDENGHYKTVLSIGWEPKNEAIRQAWEEINTKLEIVKTEIEQGSVSPLKFYITKNLMDLKMLSEYTGFSKRKIRKHLKPEAFNKITFETADIYSKVFNIEPSELMNPKLNYLH